MRVPDQRLHGRPDNLIVFAFKRKLSSPRHIEYRVTAFEKRLSRSVRANPLPGPINDPEHQCQQDDSHNCLSTHLNSPYLSCGLVWPFVVRPDDDLPGSMCFSNSFTRPCIDSTFRCRSTLSTTAHATAAPVNAMLMAKFRSATTDNNIDTITEVSLPANSPTAWAAIHAPNIHPTTRAMDLIVVYF